MATETIFTPTKIQLRNATLNGVNIYPYVQNIKVYESMCTPYIKCDITIVDNAGVIEEISKNSDGGLAAKPVTFAMYDGETYYERKEQMVFTVDASPSEENKRVQIYNIGTIGVSYLDDRKSLVQKTIRDQQASEAAGIIHRNYLSSDRAGLSILSSSLGPIAKDTIGSFPLSNIKPFKAIEDILKRASYASAANPTVYYRDANQFVIGSLEDVFKQARGIMQTSVIERSTWGTSIHDMFEAAHYGVIAAGVIVDEEDFNKARSRVHNIAAAAYQNLNIYDAANNSIIQDKPASATKHASKIAASASNKIGGMINVHQLNSLRNDPAQDPTMKRQKEQEFLTAVKDATKYLVKIPIRAGLKCTVGKGIFADLLAPGDGLTRQPRKVGGAMLIADIMHDCYFDKRTAMATSTFRGVAINDVI